MGDLGDLGDLGDSGLVGLGFTLRLRVAVEGKSLMMCSAFSASVMVSLLPPIHLVVMVYLVLESAGDESEDPEDSEDSGTHGSFFFKRLLANGFSDFQLTPCECDQALGHLYQHGLAQAPSRPSRRFGKHTTIKLVFE